MNGSYPHAIGEIFVLTQNTSLSSYCSPLNRKLLCSKEQNFGHFLMKLWTDLLKLFVLLAKTLCSMHQDNVTREIRFFFIPFYYSWVQNAIICFNRNLLQSTALVPCAAQSATLNVSLSAVIVFNCRYFISEMTAGHIIQCFSDDSLADAVVLNNLRVFYIYWTVHHCDSWRIKDQLDVTCYFISLLMCSACFGH